MGNYWYCSTVLLGFLIYVRYGTVLYSTDTERGSLPAPLRPPGRVRGCTAAVVGLRLRYCGTDVWD